MMSPEDVLVEAIAAASLHGDSPHLRKQFCTLLQRAIEVLNKAAECQHGIVQASEV